MTTVIRLLIFLVFISLMPRLGCAQNIAVSSFKLLETDMDANLQGTREVDQNGETAALIKIVTTEKGFGFSCGALGIVKTVETPGEIWLYVPRGAQKITIKHPQLGILRDYHFNTTILGGRTYEMVLTTGRVETIVKKARTAQYVIFNLTPANAVVELNGEMLQTSEGIASKMVKFGIYDYLIKAPNYLPKTGKVEVNDPNNKKVVDVVLSPNFSTVTLKVDNDAEIWVNGTLKGKSFWEGNLGAGVYEFEARKEGHKPSQITKEINITPATQTIVLDPPTPVFGDANVNSNPAGAIIYLDGKKMGTTPQILSDILIGKHKLSIFKVGYEEKSSEITIKEGEETEISINLNEVSVKDTEEDAENVKVFDVVEEMPQFPGGSSALFEYIANNLKYPRVAEEIGVQGRVIVTFVVGTDGSIKNAKISKSVDPLLDKEALRVVYAMPKWIPGKHNGRTVNVQYSVPITFRLQ